MFDAITFKAGAGFGPPIDLGSLAEALIFYGRVNIVATPVTVDFLLRRIHPRIFLGLIRSGRIALHYQHELMGVTSRETIEGQVLHDLGRVSHDEPAEDHLEKLYRKVAGSSSTAKLDASKFVQTTSIFDVAAFDHRELRNSLADVSTTERAVRHVLSVCAPEFQLPEPLQFRYVEREGFFAIETNLDFTRLNDVYHRRVSPKHSSMSVADILARLQGMNEALHISATFESDLATSTFESALLQKTIPSVLAGRQHHSEEIDHFFAETLPYPHALREAVNIGKIPFSEVVKLLESADKFRDWVQGKPYDARLLSEYIAAISAESKLDKAPTRVARMLIFFALGELVDWKIGGALGKTVGLGLTVLDSLVIDKVTKGWSPNQFIVGELQPLLAQPWPEPERQ